MIKKWRYHGHGIFTIGSSDNDSTRCRLSGSLHTLGAYDDVIKWKHFPRYWPFVRGIHRSPVNSPHKGQWRGALAFSLFCVWINGWVNNREAGDLRRLSRHYDVTVRQVAIFNEGIDILCGLKFGELTIFYKNTYIYKKNNQRCDNK